MELLRTKRRQVIWTEESDKYIEDCYVNKRMSIDKISESLRVSPNIVSDRLKEIGVHIRTDREQALKYTVNEDFFEIIDTEKKAYWLGFMYADGYINVKRKHQNKKVGLALNVVDYERLEAFKKDLNYTGNINVYTSANGYKESTYGRVLISNEKLANDLIDKGCYEKKTNKLTFPSDDIVSRELKYHFIRGYLDGDGSVIITFDENNNIKSCGIGFTGTYEFLNGLKEFLGKSSLKLDKRYKNRKDNIYSLSIGGAMQTIEICYRLYGHATTYMKRKYDKYIELLEGYFKRRVELGRNAQC